MIGAESEGDTGYRIRRNDDTSLVVSMAATASSSSSSTRGVKIKGERGRKRSERGREGRVWEWVYGGEADVINGNCAKVPRRTRVTPVPH